MFLHFLSVVQLYNVYTESLSYIFYLPQVNIRSNMKHLIKQLKREQKKMGNLTRNKKYTSTPIKPWFCLYLQERPLRWKVPWGIRRPTRLRTQTEDCRRHRLTLPTVKPDHRYRSSEPCPPRPNPIPGITGGCVRWRIKEGGSVPGAHHPLVNQFVHNISCKFNFAKIGKIQCVTGMGSIPIPREILNPPLVHVCPLPQDFHTQLTVQYQVFSAQIIINHILEILLKINPFSPIILYSQSNR